MPNGKRRGRRLKMIFYYPIVMAAIIAGVVVFVHFFEGGLAAKTPAAATATPLPTPAATPEPLVPTEPVPEAGAVDSTAGTPIASGTGRLLPYRASGRWGYKNTSGQVVIQARFSAALEFDGDSAIAAVDTTGVNLYGLIDRQGKWLAEPAWEEAARFSEGRAAVKQGGRWGFIDALGTLVVNPEYDEAGAFHDGRARVRQGEKWGYIDTGGALVIQAVYDTANDFSEGRAFCIQLGASVERPIIDVSGAQVARLKTATGTRYRMGLAAVELSEGKFGYVGLEGTLAFNTTYQEARDFEQQLAPVRKDGEWFYIGADGSEAFPARFADAAVFSEGLAAVKTDSGKFGYIDPQGNAVIDAVYDEAEPFQGGYALVRRGPERGLIDPVGQFKLLYAETGGA